MKFVRKRSYGRHTVMRSDRLQVGDVRVLRHRVPPGDPYDIGFNQHDDRNYTIVDAWSVTVGPLSVTWRPTSGRTK